jgi:hypothetical protein
MIFDGLTPAGSYLAIGQSLTTSFRLEKNYFVAKQPAT